MSVQLILAWVVPVVVLISALCLIGIDRATNPDPVIPDLQTRIEQYQTLINENPTVPSNEPKTAVMLLEQSKISYERVVTDRSSIESRATTLVGLAAAATGASALLAGGRGIAFTPTIAAAAGMGLVSLGCLLFIMRAKFNLNPIRRAWSYPIPYGTKTCNSASA